MCRSVYVFVDDEPYEVPLVRRPRSTSTFHTMMEHGFPRVNNLGIAQRL